MSAGSSGAGCGVVLGIVAVLLAQQFDYLNLSVLAPALEYVIVAAVIGGVVGGIIGWLLGRRYLANHSAPTSPAA